MFYIDVTRDRDCVVVWERDNNSELHTKKLPIADYSYCFIMDNTGKHIYRDMYGRPVKKVNFASPQDIRKFKEASHQEICESDITPEYRVMMDDYVNEDESSPTNVMLFDIDVDLRMGAGYASIDDPFMAITAFPAYDVRGHS